MQAVLGLVEHPRLRPGEHVVGDLLAAVRPQAAVAGVRAVYTDVFVSMGEEAERAAKLADLAPYRVTAQLFAHAADDAVLLHCLPAHRGEEVDDEVLEGPRSAVWDQAENRLHAQKALLEVLFSTVPAGS